MHSASLRKTPSIFLNAGPNMSVCSRSNATPSVEPRIGGQHRYRRRPDSRAKKTRAACERTCESKANPNSRQPTISSRQPRQKGIKIPSSSCSYAGCLRLALARWVGAGDGNRTHVSSLGSYSSTIELHPPLRLILCSLQGPGNCARPQRADAPADAARAAAMSPDSPRMTP